MFMYLDYFKGILFISIAILFFNLLGKRIKKDAIFSERLIIGFIFYTCFQFLGGFLCQFFRLPWVYYEVYMIVMLFCLLCFLLFKNNYKQTFQWKNVEDHFRKYFLFYLLAGVLVVLACMNIQYQWNNNLIDDGYYLNKVKLAPFVENYVDYNYTTGFRFTESITRIVNTFEIEAAFYSNIIGIEASIYCKVFMAYMNYFLILNSIYWLYTCLIGVKKYKLLYFALLPILFFGIYQEILKNFGLLFLQDSWQFNTAIWYGSSLVRHMGFLLLIIPVLFKDRLTIKDGVFWAMSVIALVSKASQVFPVVCIVALALISLRCIQHAGSKQIARLLLVFIMVILAILPVGSELEIRYEIIYEQLFENMGTIIMKTSLLLFFLSYLMDNSKIRKWNNVLLIIGVLLFVPRLNTLFLYTSLYDFVVARTITLFIFTFIITALLYAFLFISMVFKSNKKTTLLYGLCGAVLICIPLYSIQRNLGIKNTIITLANNPALLPNPTIELSEELQKLYEDEKKDLFVISPAWVVNNRTNHSLAAMLRYHALDIYTVSAIPRYNSIEETEFVTYGQDMQDIFEKYHNGEDRDDEKLHQLFNTYPINCAVVTFEDISNEFVSQYGFSLVRTIDIDDKNKYYILMRYL